MTLGTGIFSSTILLLLAAVVWQITVRKKWKLVAKIAGGIVALCAAVSGGFYAWDYVANLPPAPSVVTELAGVKLGMSPIDVTLALGKPDTAGEPSVSGEETRINYIYTHSYEPNYYLQVQFYGPDKFTTKAAIVCSRHVKLLGFDLSSSEESVIQRLGEPDHTSISSDGVNKYINYYKWNVSYRIFKRYVAEMCIGMSGVVFAEELPTLEEQRAAEAKAVAAAKLAAEAKAAEAAKTAKEQHTAKAKAAEAAKFAAEAKAAAAAKLMADPETAAVINALKKLALERQTTAETNTLVDPCAPDLSRAERLRRLSSFGSVRQTGDENYEAGSHSILFSFGNMIYCR